MFEPFPKIPRLRRNVVITEKIDGTNAQVHILSEATLIEAAQASTGPGQLPPLETGFRIGDLILFAGSRTRYLDTSKKGDNFGFAKWVADNAEGLALLGPGRHYGEWWGSGIQRGYGVEPGQRYFSLFNTARWTIDPNAESGTLLPPVPGLEVVPVLFDGRFETGAYDPTGLALHQLRTMGSSARPGFMNPEGIVVWHSAARTLQKVLLENDDIAKGEAA